MKNIHDNEVNPISECNLLHDILNTYEHEKRTNYHYFPILHGCINPRRVKTRYENFQILLNSGCISKILMIVLTLKIIMTKDTVRQWKI